MKTRQGARWVDMDLVDLKGGLFHGAPSRRVPLTDFHLEAEVDGPPVRFNRRVTDYFPPTTHPTIPPEPKPGGSMKVFALAMAAGFAGFLGGAFLRTEATPGDEPHGAGLAALGPWLPAGVDEPSSDLDAPVEPAAEPASAPAVPATAPTLAPPTPSQRVASEAKRREPSLAGGSGGPAPVREDPAPAIPPLPAAPDADFDSAAAAVALAGAGSRGNACRDGDAGTLVVPVSVTFAPSGRATVARVTGGPLVGTPEGACLATSLHRATVPRFDGEPVTVNTTVRLR